MFRKAPNIRRLRRRGRVDQLIALTRYEDRVSDMSGQAVDLGAPVRAEAVAAVSELEDPQGVRAVMSVVLDDRDAGVRAVATSCLIRLLETATAEAVKKSASTEARPTSSSDADAAAGEDAATPPAASTGKVDAAEVARVLLLAGGEELAERHEQLLLRALGAADGADFGNLVLDQLLIALDDPRPGVTERAARQLLLRAPQHVDRLIIALRDPARAAAVATALGGLHDNRALGPLLSAQRSEDPITRRACVWALGEIADSRAVTTLFEATTDPDYRVRLEAFAALDKLGSPGLIGGLVSALSALRAEAELGQRQAMSLLEANLQGEPSEKPRSDDAPAGAGPTAD